MKQYDELPWWCQLLWPWFGSPWYEQVEGLDAYLAAYWCALHLSAAELAELLAGDDPPGEGYLAKAARLTAARHRHCGTGAGELNSAAPPQAIGRSRSVAQPGSASDWGSGGRGFKSRRSDHSFNQARA